MLIWFFLCPNPCVLTEPDCTAVCLRGVRSWKIDFLSSLVNCCTANQDFIPATGSNSRSFFGGIYIAKFVGMKNVPRDVDCLIRNNGVFRIACIKESFVRESGVSCLIRHTEAV